MGYLERHLRGSAEQIHYLVEQGCIKPLCDLLDAKDARIVTVALEGLENILRMGQKEADEKGMPISEYGQRVDAEGGLDKIESLQNHQQEEIYQKAMKIIQFSHAALAPGPRAFGGRAKVLPQTVLPQAVCP